MDNCIKVIYIYYIELDAIHINVVGHHPLTTHLIFKCIPYEAFLVYRSLTINFKIKENKSVYFRVKL